MRGQRRISIHCYHKKVVDSFSVTLGDPLSDGRNLGVFIRLDVDTRVQFKKTLFCTSKLRTMFASRVSSLGRTNGNRNYHTHTLLSFFVRGRDSREWMRQSSQSCRMESIFNDDFQNLNCLSIPLAILPPIPVDNSCCAPLAMA